MNLNPYYNLARPFTSVNVGVPPVEEPPVYEPVGGYEAIPVPDKTTLAFADAPMVLTDADFAGADTLIIENREFRQLDNTKMAVNGRAITGGKTVIIRYNASDCAGRHYDFLGADVKLEVYNNFAFSAGYCHEIPNNDTDGAWFVVAVDPRNAVIEHNHIEETSGNLFSIQNPVCTGIRHRFNRYVDIAASTGPGADDKTVANYLKLFGGAGVETPNVVDEWNEIVFNPLSDKAKVEDTLSVVNFRGSAASRAKSRFNCIRNICASPHDNPVQESFTGSGQLLESPGEADHTKCTAYFDVEESIFIGCWNGAGGLHSGNHNSFRRNSIVFARKFPDGSTVNRYTTGLGGRNTYGFPGTTFDNYIEDNEFHWAYGGGGGDPIDDYTPTDGINRDESNPDWHLTDEVIHRNNAIKNTEATLADEEAKWQQWQDLLAQKGYIMGPVRQVATTVKFGVEETRAHLLGTQVEGMVSTRSDMFTFHEVPESVIVDQNLSLSAKVDYAQLQAHLESRIPDPNAYDVVALDWEKRVREHYCEGTPGTAEFNAIEAELIELLQWCKALRPNVLFGIYDIPSRNFRQQEDDLYNPPGKYDNVLREAGFINNELYLHYAVHDQWSWATTKERIEMNMDSALEYKARFPYLKVFTYVWEMHLLGNTEKDTVASSWAGFDITFAFSLFPVQQWGDCLEAMAKYVGHGTKTDGFLLYTVGSTSTRLAHPWGQGGWYWKELGKAAVSSSDKNLEADYHSLMHRYISEVLGRINSY